MSWVFLLAAFAVVIVVGGGVIAAAATIFFLVTAVYGIFRAACCLLRIVRLQNAFNILNSKCKLQYTQNVYNVNHTVRAHKRGQSRAQTSV